MTEAASVAAMSLRPGRPNETGDIEVEVSPIVPAVVELDEVIGEVFVRTCKTLIITREITQNSKLN